MSSVGMLETPKRCAVAGFWSMSSLATLTSPANSPASSSIVGDHAARAAPRRPEIDQDRDRRALDFFAECGVRHRDGPGIGPRQRRPAPPADGGEILPELRAIHMVEGP